MLLDVVHGDGWQQRMFDLSRKALRPEFNGQFSPILADAQSFASRDGGAALTSSGLTADRDIKNNWDGMPQSALELELTQDGDVRLMTTHLSASPGAGQPQELRPDAIPMLTRQTLLIASAVAEHCGYLGPWALGVTATGIAGRGPSVSSGDDGRKLGRDFGDYREVTTASADELFQLPGAVTSRLTGRLLRALGVFEQYTDLLSDDAL